MRAGKVACQCNSLQAVFPAIAAGWDCRKNNRKPSDYTAGLEHLAWWYTPQGVSWQQRIAAQTKLDRDRRISNGLTVFCLFNNDPPELANTEELEVQSDVSNVFRASLPVR